MHTEQFADQLLPGEQILWTGQPDTRFRLTRWDVFMVPFGLLWAVGAVYWNVWAWVYSTPIWFRLLGLPFLAVGVYLLAGRLLLRRRAMGRTYYCLTDRRVIILRGGPGDQSVTTRELEKIVGEQVTTGKTGVGTILFGDGQPVFRYAYTDIWGGFGGGPPAFRDIPDCRRVHALYRQAKYGGGA